MSQQIPQLMNYHSTNSAGSSLLVDELIETSREMAIAIVTVQFSSFDKRFVITETTGVFVSGASREGLRL